MSYAWTEERVETLKRLHADGESFSSIAAALGGGVTRNAVIGKALRLGCGGRSRHTAMQRHHANRQGHGDGPRKQRRRFIHNTHRREADKKPPRPIPEPPPAPVAPLMVTLMDIRADQCHFPFGEPRLSGFGYCGHPTSRGAYCAFHHRLMFVPASARSSAGATAHGH